MGEATLLERIRQYDTAALAQVYDDYHDRIYRYVYSYLGRANAAEDLTANVFLRLLQAVRRGKSPHQNLSAWLYRVAHNLVVDTFRRMPPQELELAEWLESEGPGLTQTVEQSVELERVRLALRGLTENQQQVIVLKFFLGMDSREIASIIGKSEGAVDALQHRALLALRKTLQEKQGPKAEGEAGNKQSSDDARQTMQKDDTKPMTIAGMLQCALALLSSPAHRLVAVRPGPRPGQDEAGQAKLGQKVATWRPV